MSFALALHGGAGSLNGDDDLAPARAALQQALDAGRRILAAGGPALDAAVAAVACLEDSGQFNAGKAAIRAQDGSISHDAAVMDGSTRAAGAVAAVARLKNPIHAARLVLDRSGHTLLVGEGAQSFVARHGLVEVPDEYFVPSPRSRAPVASEASHGTVGAVALDAAGHLAAATSTGGTIGKLPGRVGDSPVIGAGTYADDVCAISATGTGESFIRAVFAFRVSSLVRSGSVVADAARAGLAEVTTLGGSGGCIALTAGGQIAMPFTTKGMFRALTDHIDRVELGVFPGETAV